MKAKKSKKVATILKREKNLREFVKETIKGEANGLKEKGHAFVSENGNLYKIKSVYTERR